MVMTIETSRALEEGATVYEANIYMLYGAQADEQTARAALDFLIKTYNRQYEINASGVILPFSSVEALPVRLSSRMKKTGSEKISLLTFGGSVSEQAALYNAVRKVGFERSIIAIPTQDKLKTDFNLTPYIQIASSTPEVLALLHTHMKQGPYVIETNDDISMYASRVAQYPQNRGVVCWYNESDHRGAGAFQFLHAYEDRWRMMIASFSDTTVLHNWIQTMHTQKREVAVVVAGGTYRNLTVPSSSMIYLQDSTHSLESIKNAGSHIVYTESLFNPMMDFSPLFSAVSQCAPHSLSPRV